MEPFVEILFLLLSLSLRDSISWKIGKVEIRDFLGLIFVRYNSCNHDYTSQ